MVRKKSKKKYSKWELYNLENDPYESQNIATTYPAIVNDLVTRYKNHKSKDNLKQQ